MTNGQPDSVLEMPPALEEDYRREAAESEPSTVGPSEPYDLKAALQRATALMAQTPAQRRLDGLVLSVRGTILRKAHEYKLGITAPDLWRLADDTARNIVAGIQDQLKEVA